MKSKQEVIQEAYGEYWDKYRNYIYKDGWCKPFDEREFLNTITCDFKEMHVIHRNPEQWYRPKSLQGIETNNGWTRIYSESDLPSDFIECYVYYKTGNIGVYCFGNNDDDFFELTSIGVTHYQPIIKPKAPIY